MTALPDDIERALARQFPEDTELARAVLEPLLDLGPRVIRCVLWLSTDLDKLGQYADAARLDPRDVIWWAEFDGGEHRMRDFEQPLP